MSIVSLARPMDNAAPTSWFNARGEIADLIRSFAWLRTPLGAIEHWPASLRTLVNLMVCARQPMFLAWGPERRMLYNDGYAALCQDRHPAALGRPFAEVWHDVIDEVGPILDRAYAGEATQMDDIGFKLIRAGQPQEAHFSFSYTPVHDDGGAVLGMFCVCTETTAQVLAERRADVERERQRLALQQMPGFAGILEGPEHRYAYVNDAYVEIAGERGFVGRTVREVFPELAGQGFYELLDRVYATGEAHVSRATPISLEREDGERFIDFLYHPVRGDDGAVSGIFVGGYDVTEQVRAQRRVTAERDRCAAVLDGMGESFGLLAHDFTILEQNAEALRLDGRPREAVVGRSHWDAYPGSADSRIGLVLKKAMAERRTATLEHCHDWLDGRTTWLDMRAYPVPEGLAVFWRDVTERKEAEARIRERSEELEAVLDAVPAAIWVAEDSEARIVRGNRQAARTLRLPPDAPNMSKSADDATPVRHFRVLGSDGAEIAAADLPVQRAARGEVVRDFVERIVFDDGETVDLLGNATPLRDARGRPRGAVAAFVDITARRRTEAELAALNVELERRIAETLKERERFWDVTEDLFVTGDFDGRLLDVSTSWTRVLGWTREALLAMHSEELIEPTELDRVRERLAALRRTGTVAYENAVRTVDGGWRRIAWRLRGETEGNRIYGVGRDVTLEREQARALADAERKLVEMQKIESIGQLTGGVAHDFNNLLSAILSNLDIARKHVLDPRTARLIEGAIKGAERGASLTKRLLAFARRQELKTEAIDIAVLLAGMRDLLERSAGLGVRIDVAVPSDTPPVGADPNQLELALLNLVVNARDAMPEGGAITIAARAIEAPPGAVEGLGAGSYVAISVADTGMGMDEATLKRAAEPFFTTKGVGKGTGLGLSMVQGLAAQSGGALRLASAPGQGTRVELWLPRAAADLTTPEAAQGNAADVGPDRLTILVVDDDALVAMGTVALLEDLGHSVLEAGSGAQALAIAAERDDLDLVVTDYAMPGMTGAELADQLARLRPGLDVALATGYAELPKGQGSLLRRLSKPLRQQDLLALIDEVRASR